MLFLITARLITPINAKIKRKMSVFRENSVHFISELTTGHLRYLAITGNEKKRVIAVIGGCAVIGLIITGNHAHEHQATQPSDNSQTKHMLSG